MLCSYTFTPSSTLTANFLLSQAVNCVRYTDVLTAEETQEEWLVLDPIFHAELDMIVEGFAYH